jgi:hypothetical protein
MAVMSRRNAFLLLVIVLLVGGSGCFRNAPDGVVERFVARMRGMAWERMVELVDWPHSCRYVVGVPCLQKGEEDKKKELMLRIAEKWTDFPVKEKTPDEVRHEFLYLKVAKIGRAREGEDWAWLKVDVRIDTRLKTVDVLVMKIDRVWRIVLTDSIFK